METFEPDAAPPLFVLLILDALGRVEGVWWFAAVYLMCESKKGISANQLHRTLGVAYRTAWYLCHRIREAMGNDPFYGPTLVGVVEVDETLVGGKAKSRGRAYKGNKHWVAGAI